MEEGAWAIDVNQQLKTPYWWEGIKRINQPMILLGPEGIILGFNQLAEDILGYSNDKIIMSSLLDITDKNDKSDQVNNYLDIFYSTKHFSKSKIRLITSQNHSISTDQTMYSVNDNDHNLRYALLLFNNLSANPNEMTCESIERTINSVRSIIKMFDLEEFGSTYNREIVTQIKTKLNEVVSMIENSKEYEHVQ